MSEERLNHLRVLASHEQDCCEGVPQRVEGEAPAREPSAFEERLVLPIVEVVVVGRLANAVGEDEVKCSATRGTAAVLRSDAACEPARRPRRFC